MIRPARPEDAEAARQLVQDAYSHTSRARESTRLPCSTTTPGASRTCRCGPGGERSACRLRVLRLRFPAAAALAAHPRSPGRSAARSAPAGGSQPPSPASPPVSTQTASATAGNACAQRLGYPRYPAIGDYAIIGDCRTAALVARSGAIEWLAFQLFQPVRLRDRSRPASWRRVQPASRGCPRVPAAVFLEDTAILETLFTTNSGRVRVLDFMSVGDGDHRWAATLQPQRELIRIVEGLDGAVDLVTTVEPRPDYGRRSARASHRPGFGWVFSGPGSALVVNTDFEVSPDLGGTHLVGQATLRAGEVRTISLAYAEHEIAVWPALVLAARAAARRGAGTRPRCRRTTPTAARGGTPARRGAASSRASPRTGRRAPRPRRASPRGSGRSRSASACPAAFQSAPWPAPQLPARAAAAPPRAHRAQIDAHAQFGPHFWRTTSALPRWRQSRSASHVPCAASLRGRPGRRLYAPAARGQVVLHSHGSQPSAAAIRRVSQPSPCSRSIATTSSGALLPAAAPQPGRSNAHLVLLLPLPRYARMAGFCCRRRIGFACRLTSWPHRDDDDPAGSQGLGLSRLQASPFLFGTVVTSAALGRPICSATPYTRARGPLSAFLYAALFAALGHQSWWLGALLGALHGRFADFPECTYLPPSAHGLWVRSASIGPRARAARVPRPALRAADSIRPRPRVGILRLRRQRSERAGASSTAAAHADGTRGDR